MAFQWETENEFRRAFLLGNSRLIVLYHFHYHSVIVYDCTSNSSTKIGNLINVVGILDVGPRHVAVRFE